MSVFIIFILGDLLKTRRLAIGSHAWHRTGALLVINDNVRHFYVRWPVEDEVIGSHAW